MTPQEIAEVRPRLLDFAAEMLGGLPRKDQRAKGELYVRGLLTDGQRKAGAADGGAAGHRSSAAAAVHHVLDLGLCGGAAERGAVVRGQPAGGGAGDRRHRVSQGRHGVAVRGPAVLRHPGQGRQLPDRGERAPGERACLVRGGLAAVLPGIVGRRRAGRPGGGGTGPAPPCAGPHPGRCPAYREVAAGAGDDQGDDGPGGWGVLEEITAAGGARPVVVTDAGYGDNTAFRLELAARGWRHAVAVKGTTSAYAGDAHPVTLRQLAIASADQIQPVTWRQGTRATSPPSWPVTSWRSGSGPPTGTSPAAATAASRTAGCWPNGRPKPTSPPITGCPPCRRTPPSPSWPGWPRSAGGSSTITASSRPAWAWATSRAAHSPAGTAT